MDDAECSVGALACRCTPGGGCDPGLSCVADECTLDESDATAEATLEEQAIGDLPDCYEGCVHSASEVPVRIALDAPDGEFGFAHAGRSYQRLRGSIDTRPREGGFGYDLDFIQVLAPPRALLEVRVTPVGADADPYLSTFDPVLLQEPPLYGWMQQNDDRASDDLSARLQFVTPLLNEEPWFLVVDDARNVAEGEASLAEESRYELRIRAVGAADFATLELNDGTGGSGWQELARAGDAHYFRFHDPDHKNYRVVLETDNDDFCGHVWQVDLLEGAAWIPNGSTDDDPADGCTPELTFYTFPTAFDGNDDYGLVVTDWSGRGSNSGFGNFRYRLSLEAVPLEDIPDL